MVTFEIPTGVVADTTGRRRSFLLSAITLGVGTLAYVTIAAVGGGLVAFVVASIALGLGFSFSSGAVEAWLVDALKATGYQGQLDRVFARGEMVSGAAMLVGSVGGGVLGSLDLAWPFLVRAGLLGAVFLVGLGWMRDVGFTPRTLRLAAMPTEMGRVLHASVQFGWRSRPVRAAAAAAAAAAEQARARRRHRRAPGRQEGAVCRPGTAAGRSGRHHRPPADTDPLTSGVARPTGQSGGTIALIVSWDRAHEPRRRRDERPWRRCG